MVTIQEVTTMFNNRTGSENTTYSCHKTEKHAWARLRSTGSARLPRLAR